MPWLLIRPRTTTTGVQACFQTSIACCKTQSCWNKESRFLKMTQSTLSEWLLGPKALASNLWRRDLGVASLLKATGLLCKLALSPIICSVIWHRCSSNNSSKIATRTPWLTRTTTLIFSLLLTVSRFWVKVSQLWLNFSMLMTTLGLASDESNSFQYTKGDFWHQLDQQ